jgi:hypothetical protein
VTFFEDCIMEAYYDKDCSLIDFMGYKVSNSALTRNEYTSLDDKGISKITENSWEIKGSYKGIVYAKTATMLRTLKNWLGDEIFFKAIKKYFNENRFTHPRKADFIKSFISVVKVNVNEKEAAAISSFMIQALDETVICDFAVKSINNFRINKPTGLFNQQDELVYRSLQSSDLYQSTVTIEQMGEMIVPVEVEVVFSDGTKDRQWWDGRGSFKTLGYKKDVTIVSVSIDPDKRMYMDIDFNNNSMTLRPESIGIFKYASRSIFWVQNILQSISFLM